MGLSQYCRERIGFVSSGDCLRAIHSVVVGPAFRGHSHNLTVKCDSLTPATRKFISRADGMLYAEIPHLQQ